MPRSNTSKDGGETRVGTILLGTADLDDYRRFQIGYLTCIRGVQSVKTDIPMQKIKLTSEIPVQAQQKTRASGKLRVLAA